MLMTMRAEDSHHRWCSVGGGRVSLVRKGDSVENILSEVLVVVVGMALV